MNQLNVLRNLVVWAQSPLYLSGWIPSRQCALLSLSLSSGRSAREKGSSLVLRGQWGGLSCAIQEDCTPKDPKGSLYLGSSSSSSSLSLGSSCGVGTLSGCSFEDNSIAAASCSVVKNPLPASLGWVSIWDGGQVGGWVGTPLCSSSLKLIPGRG